MTDAKQSYGIQETKDCVDLGFACYKAGKLAYGDKKINLLDVRYLWDVIPAVSPAVTGYEKVPAELGDLSVEEASELIAHVSAKLEVDSEHAKKVIEASLKALKANYELYLAIEGK